MNETQRQHWNSDEANHWVVAQDRYDRQLQPFGDAVLTAAAVTDSDRVLDIGCGTGTTTLAAAETAATALGVDVSEPMLDLARQRSSATGTGNVEFGVGDAQTYEFATQFDVAISRFGVMFFDDPHAAFTNIAAALKPGGRVVFVCWQGLDRNDWLLVPGIAAAAHVPLPDTDEAGGPGMFSLADRAATESLLIGAGFTDVEVAPLETPMLLAGGGTVADTVEFLLATGIGKALFDGAEPAAAAAAMEAVTETLSAHHDGDGVRLGAATWLVTARRR